MLTCHGYWSKKATSGETWKFRLHVPGVQIISKIHLGNVHKLLGLQYKSHEKMAYLSSSSEQTQL